MQQQLTHKKVIIGFLASALLVIFGLYIISRANVLADTITLDLNTLVPQTKPDPSIIGPLDPRVEYVNTSAQFSSVQNIIGTVFSLVISIGGGIFVLLLLVGGVIYLTGAGNDEQTGKAKKMMIDAIIGLFIILASWGIGTWVLSVFQTKTTIESNAGIPNSVNNGTCDENEKQAIRDYYNHNKSISIDNLRKISDEEMTGACDSHIASVTGSLINSPKEIDSSGISPTTSGGVINGNDNINLTLPNSTITPNGSLNGVNTTTTKIENSADTITDGSFNLDTQGTSVGGN